MELESGKLCVKIATRSARRFSTAELAPFAWEELTAATPRFLGFGLDVVVGPVDKFGNGCSIS